MDAYQLLGQVHELSSVRQPDYKTIVNKIQEGSGSFQLGSQIVKLIDEVVKQLQPVCKTTPQKTFETIQSVHFQIQDFYNVAINNVERHNKIIDDFRAELDEIVRRELGEQDSIPERDHTNDNSFHTKHVPKYEVGAKLATIYLIAKLHSAGMNDFAHKLKPV